MAGSSPCPGLPAESVLHPHTVRYLDHPEDEGEDGRAAKRDLLPIHHQRITSGSLALFENQACCSGSTTRERILDSDISVSRGIVDIAFPLILLLLSCSQTHAMLN